MAEELPFFDARREAVELETELAEAFRRVAASGRYVLGEEVTAFERELAAYLGRRHCVGVGNGLDALRLVLLAYGVGPGDEVIVPAYTAVATWMAVSLSGAVPVGVDVDRRTYNIDVTCVAASLTRRTRAVIPVDIFGQPADVDAVTEIAAEHDLLVIEDAAQAIGSLRNGHTVGSGAAAAALSFYPTKNLGAVGDGGAVVTDDAELAATVRMLRSYGWRTRGNSEIIAGNTRLDELQASILRVKLARLDRWTARRRAIAKRYLQAFAGLDSLQLPEVASGMDAVWHLFVVGHSNRDTLSEMLARRGVGTLVHYDPLPHLTPAYQALGWRAGSLPVAEWLAKRSLSLPLTPHLADEEVEAVISAVRAAV